MRKMKADLGRTGFRNPARHQERRAQDQHRHRQPHGDDRTDPQGAARSSGRIRSAQNISSRRWKRWRSCASSGCRNSIPQDRPARSKVLTTAEMAKRYVKASSIESRMTAAPAGRPPALPFARRVCGSVSWSNPWSIPWSIPWALPEKRSSLTCKSVSAPQEAPGDFDESRRSQQGRPRHG